MDEFDAWVAFRRGERCEVVTPACYHCGGGCSGDTTERLDIDGLAGEVPVCDDPDACPAN